MSKSEAMALAATISWFSGVFHEVKSLKVVGIDLEGSFGLVMVANNRRSGRVFCSTQAEVEAFLAEFARV